MIKNYKINLLIIVNSLGYGGNETAAFQLASNIDKNKFNIYVLVINKYNDSMLETFINLNIKVQYFSTSNIFSYLFLKEYFQFLKKNKIDSVISYVFNYQIVILQAISIVAGVNKRLVRVSAMPTFNFDKKKFYFLQLLSNLFLTKQIAVSNSVKDWLIKIRSYNNKDIIVIYNGIIKKPIILNQKKLPIAFYNIMMVARMDKVKDFKTLITAISIVQMSIKNANLILIGDGPDRNILELHALEVGARVDFIGFKNNVNEILETCTIFVHSSYSEGFPNVILEAMSLGLPIIATNIPPHREILNIEEFGLLFNIGDFTKLSDIIIDLLLNENKRKIYCEMAYNRSSNFELKRMISEYETVLC